MKNKALTVTLIVLFTALIAFLVWWLFFRKDTAASGTTSDTATGTASSSVTLAKGSTGSAVSELQRRLNTYLSTAQLASLNLPSLNGTTITKLTVDGIFGDKTQAVLYWHTGHDTITSEEVYKL